jgi:hypothetical protein
MALDIEELRRQKERLDRERDELERRLQEAERLEREAAAVALVRELRNFTQRIDALKEERHQLLQRIREAAPRIGDFSYAAEDHRLTLQAARSLMKQPELFDKVVAAIVEADLHVEPRTPRFRLFRGLRPVGTLQFHAKRIVITSGEPVIDYAIISEAQELSARYPGLAQVEYADHRRVREGVPGRPADGRYAISMQFAAGDTGSLDAVLPLAMRALDHVASYWEHVTPDEEARIFEAVLAPGGPPQGAAEAG